MRRRVCRACSCRRVERYGRVPATIDYLSRVVNTVDVYSTVPETRTRTMNARPLDILLCSTPVHGHVTPLLAVSRALVDRGHRVHFLTGERYLERAAATGAS